MGTDKQDAEAERRLLDMKKELLSQSQSTQAGRKPVELDQQSVGRLSRMDAMQVQAMQMETERRRRAGVARIDAALARLADGEYGFCVECGEAVEARRLEHDPSVATCINCARKV